MKRFRIQIAIGLIAMLLVGGYIAYPKSMASATYANSIEESNAAREQLRTANNLAEAFKHVSRALRPSVVSISTESKPRNIAVRQFRMPSTPFGLSPFMDEDLLEGLQSMELPRQLPGRRGLGSGVIVRSDGHVLTNHHVVQGAEKIEVTLSDERTYPATVIGTDPETDLAVLKIDVSGLQPVTWADSEAAEVGEWVVAVGSPFGLSQPVTAGIVSALGRDDMGIANYENFIQTDAAINPGNSGGPLVNLQGQLLGINTAIASRSGTFNGVGFAIPSSMAHRVMTSIINHGQVARGYLGVMIQDLTDELASSFGFDGAGVLVGDVVPDGPGDRAGLKAGDIVTHVDEEPMRTANQLRNRVANIDPGSAVAMRIVRDGKTQVVNVSLGTRDPAPLANLQSDRSGEVGSASALGFAVAGLSDELRDRLGVERSSGVVVSKVEPGGLAWHAGIRRGDVVVSVNGVEVKSIRDYREALDDANVNSGVRLRVERNAASRYVFLKSN